MKMRLWWMLVLLLGFFVLLPVRAQDSCNPVAELAIEQANQACDSVARNQACYGNHEISATVSEDAIDFTFTEVGDIVNIRDLQSLRLLPFNVDTEAWGVSLLQVQANLPDTLPGQNVQLVLFGDVQIEDTGSEQPIQPTLLDVTANSTINIRSGPSTDYAIVGSLESDESVIADGRNEANDWVHIIFTEEGDSGWVYEPLLAVVGEIGELNMVQPGDESADDATTFGPMQAFYFTTGTGSSDCKDVPNGLLVQTPDGAAEITLMINEVRVDLGSTAYLVASEEEMVVNLLENLATVSAFGQEVLTPAGAMIRVPLDAENINDVNLAFEPYEIEALQNLPLRLLDREIELLPPLSDLSGEWMRRVDRIECIFSDGRIEEVGLGVMAHLAEPSPVFLAIYEDEDHITVRIIDRVEDRDGTLELPRIDENTFERVAEDNPVPMRWAITSNRIEQSGGVISDSSDCELITYQIYER